MADKPTKRQKIEAVQAFFDASTLEQKKTVLNQHRDVLLRKYGFFDEDISAVALELTQRQGSDMDGAIRYSYHVDLINAARNKGIDQAIQEVKGDAHRLQYLTGVPDEGGTVLAQVIYMEDKNQAHPFLSNGEVVELVAFPHLLEIRKARGQEELVGIPWGNITDLRSSFKTKGSLNTFGADMINMVWPSASYSHDGVLIQYKDTVFPSELVMFFRVRGEKNAQKLTKQLVQRIYDYRRRMGDAGEPR